MSDIATLYDQVMNDANLDKVASDNSDFDFGPDFFQKLASGDEEATSTIESFIEEARAQGASDEDIEAAINEAAEAAGIDPDADPSDMIDDDDYEQAKAAAWMQGSAQAVADALESDLAKEAGVTLDEVLDFELGGFFAEGYAETRAAADEIVEKIAMYKQAKKGGASLGKKLMDMASKGGAKAKKGAKRYGELMMGGKAVRKGGPRSGNMASAFTGKGPSKHKTEAFKSLAARAGTVGGVGALGAGGVYAATRNKK